MSLRLRFSGVSILLMFGMMFSSSTSQILGFFPPADSISIVGSCVPPSLICELHSAPVDTIIIRPAVNNPMCIGPPLPTSVRIERCYFIVRDNNDSNRYDLVLRHRGPYHPDSLQIPFGTSFYVPPGSFDLTLFVRNGGSVTDSATARFYSHQTGLSVDEQQQKLNPTLIALSQNYPNPFNPSTRITYEIRSTANVSLEILDVLGRRITTLVHDQMAPGIHSCEWSPTNVASGVYYYRLQAGGVAITKKLILLH